MIIEMYGEKFKKCDYDQWFWPIELFSKHSNTCIFCRKEINKIQHYLKKPLPKKKPFTITQPSVWDNFLQKHASKKAPTKSSR